ncbi:MAG: chemotaxis protein CheB [Desulfobacteraceae bacterium]|jgi:two-component system chemotaxis response regulator CheB
MLVFCEECGEQYQIEETSRNQHFQCRKCSETLIIPHTKNKQEKVFQAAAAIPNNDSNSATEISPTKVLIVDDSKVIRLAIRNIFQEDSRVDVVGEAVNGAEALKMITELNPDVVTMDVNMPVMDGLTAVKNIMIRSPKPVIMFSSLTEEGAEETYDALKYGAVDFMHKPTQMGQGDFEAQHKRMIEKVIMASKLQTNSIRLLRIPKFEEFNVSSLKVKYLFALGASEGGYSALLNIIPQLKPALPAAFIVILHTEGQFVDSFVKYVDVLSTIPVKRAIDGDSIEAGTCYIASGKEYVTVDSDEEKLTLQVHPSPFPERRGAVNMLMFSAAEATLERTVGVVLSGSSDDGVEGIGEVLRVGGTGIVQDPSSCLYKETSELTLKKHDIDLIFSAQTMASKINDILSPMYGET